MGGSIIQSFQTKVNRFIPQETYRNSLKYICPVTVYAINVVSLKLIYLLPCNPMMYVLVIKCSPKSFFKIHTIIGNLFRRMEATLLIVYLMLIFITLPNFILSIK